MSLSRAKNIFMPANIIIAVHYRLYNRCLCITVCEHTFIICLLYSFPIAHTQLIGRLSILFYPVGTILGAFYYGYTAMQIPGGWLGQRFGGTRVFGICLGIASVLTMLTPLAARTSVAALITLRVIEGLALVCQQKTLSTILAKVINCDGNAGTSAINIYF